MLMNSKTYVTFSVAAIASAPIVATQAQAQMMVASKGSTVSASITSASPSTTSSYTTTSSSIVTSTRTKKYLKIRTDPKLKETVQPIFLERITSGDEYFPYLILFFPTLNLNPIAFFVIYISFVIFIYCFLMRIITIWGLLLKPHIQIHMLSVPTLISKGALDSFLTNLAVC